MLRHDTCKLKFTIGHLQKNVNHQTLSSSFRQSERHCRRSGGRGYGFRTPERTTMVSGGFGCLNSPEKSSLSQVAALVHSTYPRTSITARPKRIWSRVRQKLSLIGSVSPAALPRAVGIRGEDLKRTPNQSVEPTGGSRFDHAESVSQGRLPPVAHAWRSACTYELLRNR